MRYIIIVVIAVMMVTVSVGDTARADAEIAADRRVRSAVEVLDAWLMSRMEYDDLPGVVIGVMHDQETILERGYGYADRDGNYPADSGTLFRIASISKLFTSIAIMKLCEEGALRLDDPVSGHLPWFTPAGTGPDDPPITIRHLLTHTSGLPREAPFPYWSDFTFPSREEMIAAFPEQEPVFPPSTQWKYSNLALSIAGEIVAAVSGREYEDYITGEILEPLGMTDTLIQINENNWRLARGYSRMMPDGTREIMPFTDSKGITPAANFSSTVEDFSRFAAWQMRLRNGGEDEILSSYTLREMQRPHWVFPSWDGGWGLGFSITHTDERDLVGHGGHVGGYRTHYALSPDENIAITVFTNADDGAPDEIAMTAFAVLAPAINAAADSDEPPPEPDPAWEPLTGLYRDRWGDTYVAVYDGKLVMFNPQAENPLDAMTELEPLGDLRFRIGEAGYGPAGETVRFEMRDGRVERMWVGENYIDPAP